MSQKFKFPEPVQLTTTALDYLDTGEEQHKIYYYRADSQFDTYIRNMTIDTDELYRVFDGRIKKYAQGKCPTLTASMNSPRNAAVLRDNWGVRRITLREALRFQGFPKEYYFPNTIQLRDAYKQIGNSVSVPVIKRIAEEISKVIN